MKISSYRSLENSSNVDVPGSIHSKFTERRALCQKGKGLCVTGTLLAHGWPRPPGT